MIKKISSIMEKNLMKMQVLNGVRKIEDIFHREGIECFIVYEEKNLIGVITEKELVGAHPNRLAADVMSDKYLCVDYGIYIWEIKEIFHLNRDVNVILVEKEHKIVGYITRAILHAELGKYFDSLTGLYKRDYMFYQVYKLIKQGKHATIIFIDLNNFGDIDKKYGHIMGDIVLKDVADILKNILESNHYLYRYGGDEFVIVTPYGTAVSRLLAEKIIRLIKSHLFLNDISISASIGITGCRIQNNKIENISALISKLVNIASLASTKAKKDRNHLVIVEDLNIDEIA